MKIICIGRNYLDHAREMNADIPHEPIFFLKADSCLQKDNRIFFIPDFTNNLQYELEIVLRIAKVGKAVEPRFAHRYYDAITVGIDFTARDLQERCKKNGLPWEISKSFDQSARIGQWIKMEEFDVPPKSVLFWLKQNDKIVQQAYTRDMIFSFDQLIAYVSRFMTMKIGDIIFTGTPSGVGQVFPGDRLTAGINDQVILDFLVK
jgi:acylpyruvate hydrolase